MRSNLYKPLPHFLILCIWLIAAGSTYAQGVLGLGGFGVAEAADDATLNVETEALTIELWVKHDGESDADAFLVNKGTTSQGYRLQFEGEGDGPRLRFAIQNVDSPSWDVISNAGVPAGRWTHVGAVYNGAQMQLYINGELDTSVDFGAHVPGTNTSPLTIGADEAGTSNLFSGRVDDLRIWSEARTAFDLRAAPYAPLEGTEENLVTYFRFDEVGAESAQSTDVLHAEMELLGAEVATGGVYPIPPDLFARAQADVAELRWTERVLNPEVFEAAEARIYRSTTADGSDRQFIGAVAGGAMETVDTDVAPNTGYFYEATVVDALGKESGYSPIAFALAADGGGSVAFDGAGDYVEVGNHAVLDGSVGPYVNFDQSFTIELWVKHDGESDADAFLVNKGTNAEGYRLQFVGEGDEPALRFAIRNVDSPSWDVISQGTVPAGVWTHVGAVYNGAQMQLYIDGELDTSIDFGEYFAGINNNALTIGASDLGAGNFFSGELDDLRLWAVPRTASEIAANLDAELYGDAEGLLAYFRFDETSGDIGRSSATIPLTAVLLGDAAFTAEGAPVPTEDVATPTVARLDGNYPNPFAGATSIPYAVAEPGPVRLTVYDVLGREVAVVVDEVQAAGTYTATLDVTALPSGTYFYRLETGSSSQTRSMLHMK